MQHSITYQNRRAEIAFPDYQIKAVIDHLERDKGELTLTRQDTVGELHLANGTLTLTSLSGKKDFVNHLKDVDGLEPAEWKELIEIVCVETLRKHRAGEPSVELTGFLDELKPVKYLLEPLILEGCPTIIFGDGGSGKSLLALLVSYLVELPHEALGFKTKDEPTKVLYLDYESTRQDIQERWTKLIAGFGHPEATPINYLQCFRPIADMVEQVRNELQRTGCKLIVIDSLLLAAGGNINDSDSASRFYAALRELGVTSLAIAHNAKSEVVQNKTVFGSVFFQNLARSVWECRAEPEVTNDELINSIKCVKANNTAKGQVMGFKFTFSDKAIKVATKSLEDTMLCNQLPLVAQISSILRLKPAKSATLAEMLGKPENTIRSILSRNNKRFVKLPTGEWGNKYD